MVQGNQALVNALEAAALAAGAQAPLRHQPPEVVQFAEAPALANVDAILDYSTKQGVAIFEAGFASCPTKCNLGQAGLVVFIGELQDRAEHKDGPLEHKISPGTSMRWQRGQYYPRLWSHRPADLKSPNRPFCSTCWT